MGLPRGKRKAEDAGPGTGTRAGRGRGTALLTHRCLLILRVWSHGPSGNGGVHPEPAWGPPSRHPVPLPAVPGDRPWAGPPAAGGLPGGQAVPHHSRAFTMGGP